MQVGLATVGAGRCLLAEQRGGGHLSARHAVDGVVDEDHRDVLATVQRVDALGGADAGHVAVALIAEHHAVGPQALHGRSHCGSTSVGGLLPVDVDILVGKHRASHGADADGLLFDAHFLNHFSN